MNSIRYFILLMKAVYIIAEQETTTENFFEVFYPKYADDPRLPEDLQAILFNTNNRITTKATLAAEMVECMSEFVGCKSKMSMLINGVKKKFASHCEMIYENCKEEFIHNANDTIPKMEWSFISEKAKCET